MKGIDIMENNVIELKLVSGNGKDGKAYYGLKIRHNYESGKHFTEMIFLKENEYNYLKNNSSIVLGE